MLSKEEVLKFMERGMSDRRRSAAKIAQNYFDGKHDIANYRIWYYDAEGHLVEDKTKANIKISHPFFTELVEQATQYLLSSDERIVLSDDTDLQEKLDAYFNDNDDFRDELSEVAKGAQIKGSDYMYVYRNEKDMLAFQHADSLHVIEVRASETESKCDAVIYWYVDRYTRDGEPITKIEVWDDKEVMFYVQKAGELQLDKDVKINPRPHVLYDNPEDDEDNDESTVAFEGFGYVPFFRLDNNKERKSDIIKIKPLIDDYDLMACGLSNNIQDFTEGYFAVAGFDGDNLDEMIHNLKTKKVIGVGENGSVDIKTVSIPYEARKMKMDIDEKNIYRFGMGFNSAQVGDGNITNVVIKSRYALLDLKVNNLEKKLKKLLRKLVQLVLNDINKKEETGYQIDQVYFKFERNIITNESDNANIERTEADTKGKKIETLLNLYAKLGDEVFMEKVCETMDWDYSDLKGRIPDPVTPEDDFTNDNEE